MKTIKFNTTLSVLLGALLINITFTDARASAPDEVMATTTEAVVTTTTAEEKVYPVFSEKGLPRASDTYWHRMAYCETRNSQNPFGNWQNGGRFAGGLGIMTNGEFGDSDAGTWERWGGEEFAPSPDKATMEEQIIVANRISTQGYETIVHRDPAFAKRKGVPVTYVYKKRPVGFRGWGCHHTVGLPALSKIPVARILLEEYEIGESSKAVVYIQQTVGARPDGVYGEKTKERHLAYVEQYRDFIEAEIAKYGG